MRSRETADEIEISSAPCSLALLSVDDPAEEEDQDEGDLAPGTDEDALDDDELDTDRVTRDETSLSSGTAPFGI